MRGLIKLTQAAQTAEAWSDWKLLAAQAYTSGYGEQADNLWPPEGAGWRRVDACIDKLMAAMGLTMSFFEWKQAHQEAQP